MVNVNKLKAKMVELGINDFVIGFKEIINIIFFDSFFV